MSKAFISKKKFISSQLILKFVHVSGHDTGPGESGKKYRPLFLDHFDKKESLVSTSPQLTPTNENFIHQQHEPVSTLS